MPPQPRSSGAERFAALRDVLRATYPSAHCELVHSNPLELLVATILSAQCTDKRVNLVAPALFRRYRSAADFATAPVAAIETAIRSTGFFRNKAKNIQACCRKLVACHGGDVPRTLAALVQLEGVGRKTANVVLGNAFGLNEGVVVDTHVARLAARLGMTREHDPEKIEQDLMGLVPRAQWTDFSHWLIWHGRRRCFARSPDCAHCELRALCPARDQFPTTGRRKQLIHLTAHSPPTAERAERRPGGSGARPVPRG